MASSCYILTHSAVFPRASSDILQDHMHVPGAHSRRSFISCLSSHATFSHSGWFWMIHLNLSNRSKSQITNLFLFFFKEQYTVAFTSTESHSTSCRTFLYTSLFRSWRTVRQSCCNQLFSWSYWKGGGLVAFKASLKKTKQKHTLICYIRIT